VVVDLTIKTIKRVSGQIVSGPTYKTKAYVIFFPFEVSKSLYTYRKKLGQWHPCVSPNQKFVLKKKKTKPWPLKKTKQIKTKA
jgi:hypothetical protein